MTSLSEINQQFQLGKLPDCLNFSLKQPDEIDWKKVAYNTYYKSPEFWLNKFDNPTAFLNLPAGAEIIQSMIENSTTPLEEMTERQNINISSMNINDGLDKSTSTAEPTHRIKE